MPPLVPATRPQSPRADPASRRPRSRADPASHFRGTAPRPAAQVLLRLRRPVGGGETDEEEPPRQETRRRGGRAGGGAAGRPAALAAGVRSYAASPAPGGSGEPRARGAVGASQQPERAPPPPRGTPGAVVLSASALRSGRLDPYPSPPLGAGPRQPRTAACALTHLRNHFAGHDSGLSRAAL